MIDHISVRVQDFGRAVSFYKAALAPIGYDVLMQYPGAAGLGEKGKPDIWLMQTEQTLNPTHLALTSSREAVDAFYAAALAAGGVDNGPPGVRLDYHPTYYAAYVRDPEGNNIEVVCHVDPSAPKQAATAKARRPKAKAKPKAKARKAAPKKKAAKRAAKKSKKRRR